MANKETVMKTRLQFDGEKEYKQAVKDINNSLKVLGSEMKVLSQEYAGNDKSMEALQARQQNLKGTFEEQKKKVDETQKALNELKEQYPQNTDAIARYEVALNNAKASMLKTQNQISALDKEIEKNSSTSEDYKDVVREIDDQLRVLGAELKTAAAQYDNNKNSAEGLQAKQKILNSVLEQQEKKVEQLSKAYNDANSDTGKMSKETTDLKVELEQAKAAAAKTKNEIDNLGNEMKDTASQTEDANANIEKMRSISNGAKIAVAAFATAVTGLVAAFLSSGEATREYRTDLSKLEQNTRSIGGKFSEVKEELKNLNAITGETDSNIEALSNLMATGFQGEGLTAAVDALSGAVIKFPDTLKIESLADGLQETLATGAATGQFAEVLERLGYNLDDFNAGLSQCTTSAEKQDYALQVLAKTGLSKVNQQYRDNNKELIASADAQFKYNDAMARLGNIADPIMASFMDGLADILDMVADLVENSDLPKFINNVMKLLKDIIRAVLPVLIDFMQWCIDNKETVLALLAGIAAGLAAFKVGTIIMQVVSSLKLLIPVIQGADAATKALNTTMNLNPVLLIISGIIALTAAIASYCIEASKADEETQAIAENVENVVNGMKSSREAFAQTTNEIGAQANLAKGLVDELAELEAKESLTATEQARMATLVEKLNTLYPDMGVAIDETTGKMNMSTDAMYQNIDAMKEQALAAAYQERNAELAKEWAEAEAALYDVEQKRSKNMEVLNNAERDRQKIEEEFEEQLKKLYETEEDGYIIQMKSQELERERQEGLDKLNNSINEAEKSNAALVEQEKIAQEEKAIANAELDANIEKTKASTQANQENVDGYVAGNQAKTDSDAAQLETQKAMLEEQQAIYDERVGMTQNAFDRIEEKTAVSVSNMIANLEANQSAITNWTTNLGTLTERGLDAGLLAALREAGPEAAGTVRNLVNASDDELDRLNQVFQNGSQVAIDSMKLEMGLPTTVNTGKEMIDDVAESASKNEALKKAAVQSVVDAKNAMETQVETSDFASIGVQAVSGVIRGLDSQRDRLISEVKSLADEITRAFKVQLDIKSPSGVLDREVGVDAARGVGRGFVRQMKQEVKNMTKALPTHFDNPTPDVDIGYSTGTRRGRNRANRQNQIAVNQYFYGNENNFAKQQREAAKNFKMIARTL